METVVIDQKLVLFAGASNSKKSVSLYHGDHLKKPPPTIGEWKSIAGDWLNNIPIGQWYVDGEKISNYKDQWIFVDVKDLTGK
jgi:hypothetical protein